MKYHNLHRILSALAVLCGLICNGSLAGVIPASRLSNWQASSYTGVPGGIPSRTRIVDVTKAPYTANNSGGADASVPIQNAVNAAVSGDVIYLPSGTYRFDSPVFIGYKNGVTVRGAGPGQTIIDFRSAWGSAFSIGGSRNYPWEYPQLAIQGSPRKGDTFLPISDTSIIRGQNLEGRICSLSLESDTALPVVSVAAFPRARSMKARVVAISASGVTIHPGLHFDLPANLSPRFGIASFQAEFTGIESLTVNATNSSTPNGLISMGDCYGCWFYNVETKKSPNYNFVIGDSVFCEMRKCRASDRKTAGTNGAGLLMGASGNCLIEDNIFDGISPSVEVNASCTGNAFAYNFMIGTEVSGVIGASINSNHGPHNSFNLYEGNVGARFQCDGYFGGASEDTLFRNWFHGTSENVQQYQVCVYLNRFTRNYNIVGNVLGRTAAGRNWKYSNGGPAWHTESGSSITMGTGSRTFTVPSGLSWNNISAVLAYSKSTPSKRMQGNVQSYSGTNLTVQITDIVGNGTASDWVIVGGCGFNYQEAFCLVVGLPNIGNGGFARIAQPSIGAWWAAWNGTPLKRRGQFSAATAYSSTASTQDVVDYNDGTYLQWIANNPAKHGLTTWETPATSSRDWTPISPSSYQELDADVANTLFIGANWNAQNNGISSYETSVSVSQLESSLIYSSKPAYFGNLTWPPINPSASPQSFEIIPAAYRYYRGTDVPGGSSSTGSTVLPPKPSDLLVTPGNP